MPLTHIQIKVVGSLESPHAAFSRRVPSRSPGPVGAVWNRTGF